MKTERCFWWGQSRQDPDAGIHVIYSAPRYGPSPATYHNVMKWRNRWVDIVTKIPVWTAEEEGKPVVHSSFETAKIDSETRRKPIYMLDLETARANPGMPRYVVASEPPEPATSYSRLDPRRVY